MTPKVGQIVNHRLLHGFSKNVIVRIAPTDPQCVSMEGLDENSTSICFCFDQYYQFCPKKGEYYENMTDAKGYHIPNTGCP